MIVLAPREGDVIQRGLILNDGAKGRLPCRSKPA